MPVEGERELEDFLTGVFEGRAETETPAPPAEEEPREPEQPAEEELPPAPEPEEIPSEPEPPTPEEQPAPPEEEEPQPAEEEGEEEALPISWAKRKYGDDPAKWANAAYQMEQHISKLSQEKKEAEEFARQMAEYAQYTEQQAIGQQQAGMPLSAQEEMWIDGALSNPLQGAVQALLAQNVPLYNGLISRIAEENPTLAANVGAQAQLYVTQQSAAQQVQMDTAQIQTGDFQSRLGESFQRLGIDMNVHGPQMSEKIGELGEYHPYVQTIINSPDPEKRDLALMAVLDLVRSGQATTRRARETEHEARIRREQELRREAASVVTGAPHVEPKKESPLMEAMMAEWRRAGQWTDDTS